MSIASFKTPSYKADTGMSEVSLRSRVIGERAFPMLKTTLTMAGILTLVQAVQLPVAEAQSGYPSSIYPGSLQVGVGHRPVLFPNHTEGESPAHDGGKGTRLPRSSEPDGFVCCVSPGGSALGVPE